MSGIVALLLVGAAAGLVFTVADRLVTPVVRGWLADRRAPDEWALATSDTLANRLIGNLVAVALIGGMVLAFLLAGAA